MDVGIIIALLGLAGTVIVSLINSASIKKINDKINTANAKKINAEADNIIFELKNKTIKDLQDQINELKKDIEKLKTREHIHIQEKVRLEEQLAELRSKNLNLRKKIEISDLEIESLNREINKLKTLVNKFKAKTNDISNSRTS